jgi:hypothetical protein
MFDIERFKSYKMGVRCYTEQDAQNFLKAMFHIYSLSWYGGNNNHLQTNWNVNKDETVYLCNPNKGVESTYSLFAKCFIEDVEIVDYDPTWSYDSSTVKISGNIMFTEPNENNLLAFKKIIMQYENYSANYRVVELDFQFEQTSEQCYEFSGTVIAAQGDGVLSVRSVAISAILGLPRYIEMVNKNIVIKINEFEQLKDKFLEFPF